jgi:cytochrome bd-type quinol oxidase subunit 2
MMKKTITAYSIVAIILEAILARAYQITTPGFRQTYARFYGQDLVLPHITEFFLTLNWVFYLPPMAITLGLLIALKKHRDAIAMHTTFLGLITFLCLGVFLVMALFLPFVVTLGKVNGLH